MNTVANTLDLQTLAAIRNIVVERLMLDQDGRENYRDRLRESTGTEARRLERAIAVQDGAVGTLKYLRDLLDVLTDRADAEQARYYVTCEGRRALAAAEVA